MRRTGRRMLSLILVLIMAMSMIGAAVSVSYAATPSVVDYCGTMWIWPSGAANAWVQTSTSVTGVTLQKYSGSWQDYATCNATDDYKDFWYGTVRSTSSSDNGSDWTFRFAIKHSGGTIYSPQFTVHVTNEVDGARVAGANRFETATMIADLVSVTTDDEYKNVVIACGTNFADALGGTYLAAIKEAPILLVANNTQIMNQIADNIKSNLVSGGRVYILGGSAAVPYDMESILESKGIARSMITRYEGSNRYDTNLKILKDCNLTTEEVMVCCGTNFADALSASALGYPVLLVGKTLTEDQKAFMNTIDPYWVNMVGGEAAVPAAVMDWFNDNNFYTWRYAGDNRYHTSYMLAYDYILHQSYFAFLAYGMNFPDGLAGGPLAYRLGAPLLLVQDTGSAYMYAEQFVLDNDCRYGIAFGGPTLISDETIYRVMWSTDLLSSAPAARGPAYAGAPETAAKPAPLWSKKSAGERVPSFAEPVDEQPGQEELIRKLVDKLAE